MVVKLQIEKYIEPGFDIDSYGYITNKSALQAVGKVSRLVRKYDYILDLDFKTFFDTVDHKILEDIVEKKVKEDWCKLYIKRWIKVPFETRVNNTRKQERRKSGTPQGGVISPILANMFLDEIFDKWIRKRNIEFVRFADDSIIFCKTKKEIAKIKEELERHLIENKIQINKEKTNIVSCKENKIEFLGFVVENSEKEIKIEISDKNVNRIIKEIEFMNIENKNIKEISNLLIPKIRGWINYYGTFNVDKIFPILESIRKKLIQQTK